MKKQKNKYQELRNFYQKTLVLQENLRVTHFELKILILITLSISQIFLQNLFQHTQNYGGFFRINYDWLKIKSINVLNFHLTQIKNYVILVLQLINFLTILNYYIDFAKNKQYNFLFIILKDFTQQFYKFLFLGGYWIFTLIIYNQIYNMQYQNQYVLVNILNVIVASIILMYTMFINYLGLPEFMSYTQKSIPTTFFIQFQLKSLLPFFISYFSKNLQIQSTIYIFLSILIQWKIYQQLRQKPFYKEEVNKLFFCTTFFQSFQHAIFYISKIILNVFSIQYSQAIDVIISPILVKLIMQIYDQDKGMKKKGLFEYLYYIKDWKILIKQKNQIQIFQMISYAKKHLQVCDKIHCVCKILNKINIPKKNKTKKFPQKLNTPIFYIDFVLQILIHDVKQYQNSQDQWFYCSRIGLHFMRRQHAIIYFKFLKNQYQNFKNDLCELKLYYYINDLSSKFEKKILLNDLKHVEIEHIIQGENQIELMKKQIQNYIQTYNQLIYECQKRNVDLNIIQALNEKLFLNFEHYYQIYIQVKSHIKIQKLHELFFENFVLIHQDHQQKSEINTDLFQHETQKFFFSDNYYFFTISISPQQLGVIDQVSSNIQNCFGLTPQSMIGKSINITFEKQFWKYHDQYLENYIKNDIRKITLFKHQVFLKHSDGYTFQCQLQQKMFFFSQKNDFQVFVLIKRQDINQQVILVDRTGYVINYTQNFLNKFQFVKNSEISKKLNISQIIPQSIQWLVDLNTKQRIISDYQNTNNTIKTQVALKGVKNTFVHSIVFNDINSDIEKFDDYQRIFDKLINNLQEENKSKVQKKLFHKLREQKSLFLYKFIILYEIKVVNLKDFFIITVEIKDKKDINLKSSIEYNQIFQMFYKIIVLRIFITRWQKKRKNKQMKFFKLKFLNMSTSNKNFHKLFVTNSRHQVVQQKTNGQGQIDLFEKSRQDQSILKDILEKNKYVTELKIAIILSVLLFLVIPFFYTYLYKKNEKIVENSVKLQQQDLLKLQMQSYLQISLFLEQNYPQLQIIKQTIKGKLLRYFHIYYYTYFDDKNQETLLGNNFSWIQVQTNELEFNTSTYYQIIKYKQYDIFQIYDNLDKILSISEIDKDKSYEDIHQKIMQQYYLIIACLCLIVTIALLLSFAIYKVAQFINKIYKFSILIKKSDTQVKKIKQFCRLNQIEINDINLLEQCTEQNNRLVIFKKIKISFKPIIIVVLILYGLNFFYFKDQQIQYNRLLTEVKKIQISKKNLLKLSIQVLELYKNHNSISKKKISQMIQQYETTRQTFDSYTASNKEFDNQIKKTKMPVIFQYQIRQTMKSTTYFYGVAKYIYEINELLLKNYLELDQNSKTSSSDTLQQIVFVLIMKDLFYDNIDIIIRPIEKNLQDKMKQVSFILIFFNLLLFLIFWIKFIKKIQTHIHKSFYILKFIDKQKYYTNSQLKIFASKLSSFQ